MPEPSSEVSRFIVFCLPGLRKAQNEHVAGQPLILLSDRSSVLAFLSQELLHDRLNELVPIMRLVSTRRHDNIYPLHAQIVQGRRIIITENPGLHLLWYYDRIFIKPLPPYLMDHEFWERFLPEKNSPLHRAALGLMRSYYYLIRSQSDMDIAIESRLVPVDKDRYAELLKKLNSYREVNDVAVTARYQYGELRLTRLNFYIKFYKRELYYHRTYGQYGEYLSNVVAPWVFVFLALSTALSAMQLVLAARQSSGTGWASFSSASQWFGVACLLLTAACIFLVLGVVVGLLLREALYTIRHHKYVQEAQDSS
jgi:hypothetical protein